MFILLKGQERQENSHKLSPSKQIKFLTKYEWVQKCLLVYLNWYKWLFVRERDIYRLGGDGKE